MAPGRSASEENTPLSRGVNVLFLVTIAPTCGMVAMATQDMETVRCERCGGEMSLRDSGSRKSPPIIGEEREWRRFACPECGMEARFIRTQEEGWKRKDG